MVIFTNRDQTKVLNQKKKNNNNKTQLDNIMMNCTANVALSGIGFV